MGRRKKGEPEARVLEAVEVGATENIPPRIAVVTLSASGHLAAWAYDNKILLWDLQANRQVTELTGQRGWVNAFSWHPKEDWLAFGDLKGEVRFWLANGEGVAGFAMPDSVIALTWSRDGKSLAAGSGDGAVALWSRKTGESALLSQLPGAVTALTWTPDSRQLVAGDSGGGLALLTRGGRLQRLRPARPRGGRDAVWRFAWSPDGHPLAVGYVDGLVELWDGSFNQVDSYRFPGGLADLAFSPDGQYLYAANYTGKLHIVGVGSRYFAVHGAEAEGRINLEVRQGKLLLTSLLTAFGPVKTQVLEPPSAPTQEAARYKTVRIALVGDSGVGKTGLGWRLAHGAFKEHPSTHGQQFWVLPDLSGPQADGTECEAVLWDLAGQPDYRIVHSLFLDDVDLALLLFDPTGRQEALKGVEYWLKVLQRTKRNPPVILVGARTDRGEASLTPAEIDAFCRDRGITGGYIPTSAMVGTGLPDLLERIEARVPWRSLDSTITTQTFKALKDAILKAREAAANTGGQTLIRLGEFRELLRSGAEAIPDFPDQELDTAVRHLENHGYLQQVRASNGERYILLAPDLLNNLAASFVLEARRNEKGLGALDEARVRSSGYQFKELNNLGEAEREILLDAATALFLEHNICFRERLGEKTYLIFPSLINLKKPQSQVIEIEEGASYLVSGPVENVYAALVVLLGYTNTFTRTNQWQNQAEYQFENGEVCGFRLVGESEGEIELLLYFGVSSAGHTRTLFEGLFERFLRGRPVDVHKFPPVACPQCGYRQQRAAIVERTRAGKSFLFCADCGHRIPLPKEGEALPLARPDREKVRQEQIIASQKTAFEQAMTHLRSYLEGRNAPTCFISYAWGNPDQERWVEKRLAVPLKQVGVSLLLDRWHNAQIGANVARFVEQMTECQQVLVVGTPRYLEKHQNRRPDSGYMVAAEMDLINTRLTGTEAEKRTILPILLEGEKKTAFPPLLKGKVYADFRNELAYYPQLFDLILTLYGIPFHDRAVIDLRTLVQSAGQALL